MHRNQPHPATATPPSPSGRLLARTERPGRGFGPDTELRVSLDEFQGSPFLNVRVWTQGKDGGWWPSQKGVSVRVGEADEVAAALIEGARLAHAPQARPARSTPRPTTTHRPVPVPPSRPNPEQPSPPASYDADFDEFA